MNDSPAAPHPTGGRPPEIASNRPLTLFVHGTLLLGATAAVFLVVGPEQGSLGIFLACAGMVMTLCPPRVRVDWRLWAVAGGIVAGGALAFLPWRWFPVPAWRAALQAAPVISLPDSVSPVPGETGFWLALLAVSALAGLFALAHPLRTAGLVGLVSVAVAVCATYTALAIYSKQTGWHYPFAGKASFGFFPNRNHTATFLVVGSILAMGLLRTAWRDGRWLAGVLAAVGLLLFLPGLGFFSASRGGVVFLLLGTAIWVAGLGGRERNGPLFVSVGVLILAGGLLFAVSGSDVRNRLLPAWSKSTADTPVAAENLTSDFRVRIYEDTSHLIRDAPLTGIGLGAFAPVFPQYRQQSFSESAALHPESDWLMLAAEAGLPAAACAGLLGWLLLRRCRHWRPHPSWPLRWACAVAVTTACLHGIVDVPIHRVVLGWWVLTLVGAGFHGGWTREGVRSRAQHAGFVAGGLLALGLGLQLIRAQWFGAPPLPPFAAAKAQREITAAFNRQDIEGAMNTAREAVAASPMAAPLYYQYGVLLLRFEETETEVDNVFKAQRLLVPNWPDVPLHQGDAWIGVDPQRTAVLWTIALQRREHIIQTMGGTPEDLVGYYRGLLSRAHASPVLERKMVDTAARSPAFALTWLDGSSPAVVREQLSSLVQKPGLLAEFSPSDRQRFLLGWYAKGDRAALDQFLGEHPEWAAAAWPVHLRQMVAASRFEQAVREAAAHYQVSLDLPASSTTDSTAPAGSTNDPVGEFKQAWQAGNMITARRALAEGDQPAGAHPATDPELWRLRAALAMHDLDWPAAWRSLANYLRQTRPGDNIIP